MASLNRKNDEMYNLMNARTDKRNDPRPDKLAEIKQFYFEKLEYARQFNPKWYRFLLKKYLKRLAS